MRHLPAVVCLMTGCLLATLLCGYGDDDFPPPPALTPPQVRLGLAALLRESLGATGMEHAMRCMNRKSGRKELARFYHWKRRNRLAPLRLAGRRLMETVELGRFKKEWEMKTRFDVFLVVFSCFFLVTRGNGASIAAAEPKEKELFGAEANPSGDPVGGGKGYRRVIALPNDRVKTRDQLLSALKKAKPGQIICVDDVEIDLTGKRGIIIPGGVTLAGARGRGDSSGALIYTHEDKATPAGERDRSTRERFSLFETGGPNVRVTGIRLRGPDTKRRGRYAYINSDGIFTTHDKLEVDNCELWGWSHGGVYLKGGTDAHIHHNSIHHCQRNGLGYGVVLDKAEALIEANIFDWCRHAIAATGRSPSGYEARYNLVLEHANGHSFDMHGGRDRRDGTNIAGDWMKIHHNTFRARVTPIVIRGRPTKSCEVHHNWFVHKNTPEKAVRQTNATGNMKIYHNRFTKSGRIQ